MNVRLATQKDLPQILSLYRELHAMEAPLELEAAAEIWKSMKTGDLCNIFVAVLEERILSCSTLAVIPNLTRKGRPYGVIENVITHPDYRRQGAARAVFKAILAYARERNCYKVMLLSSAERKDAHAFYESLGFEGDRKKGFDIRL